MPTNPHKKRYRKDLRDAHREYVNERKELGYTKHPTYKEYSGVIIDFFKEIFKMMLFDNFTFVTNIGTFTLAAEKRKIGGKKKPYVNIPESVKRGKKILHLNQHTHGYVYKLAWIRDGVRIRNLKIYELALADNSRLKDEYLGKRGIAKYLKETETDPTKSLPIPKTLKYRL